jgi:single-strand DNA-binding protein
MAGSYNKVLLMGNLTRDVELKYTQNNRAVANIGMAVNRRYRLESGEQREEVTFVDCEAWGRTAETMSKYLAKGRPVFIEGRLKLDQWEDQQGNKRSKLRVVVDNFQFIDSKPGGDGPRRQPDDRGGYGSGGSGGAVGGAAPVQDDPMTDDDIPF